MTSHSTDIEYLRAGAELIKKYRVQPDSTLNMLEQLACLAAADLLECHDETGIELDAPSAENWLNLVEYLIGHPLNFEES
jgi:hypothetical protein